MMNSSRSGVFLRMKKESSSSPRANLGRNSWNRRWLKHPEISRPPAEPIPAYRGALKRLP